MLKPRLAFLLSGPTLCATALTNCAPSPVADAATAAPTTTPTATDPAPPTNPYVTAMLGRMDPQADPCEDFFRYACGGWIDRTPLPPDKPRWGTFGELAQRNNEAVRDLLAQAAEAPNGDADRQRVGDFYTACMDEAAINGAGAAPLAAYLDKIDAVQNRNAYMRVVGEFHRQILDGGGALFSAGVYPDAKQPDRYIVNIGQGGLGFLDRDFYLKDDPRSKQLLTAYGVHVEKMLLLSGTPPERAQKGAVAILAFETRLAELSWPRADLRDPDKTYNKIDRKGLQKLNRKFAWKAYFDGAGAGDTAQDIDVAVPDFISGMTKLVARTKLDTLKAYLRWHVVKAQASNLSAAFENEAFRFSAMVSGAKELPARWERCVSKTTGAFPEIVGRYFVNATFPGDSKDIALTMIGQIEAAFAAGLPTLAWMDDTTRQRAITKMHAITNKIGHPDNWRDYSSVGTQPTAHFANVLASNEFEARRKIARIGQSVDKTEWFMPPSIVNAYYNPSANEIVFPAGILQPPFFHREMPAPMNYGAIGMVMGHELTHGFDDSGRKYDGTGRLTPWWEPEVSARFDEQASCVEKRYSTIEVQPGARINGKLTLGENIADLGGLKQAYAAYHAAATSTHAPSVAGWAQFTADQLFFLAYSQAWCSRATPEVERMMITLDSHAPPKYRVNVPMSNLSEFWDAFQCVEGTAMHPQNTCEVW
ncbi:MAG: M13 family metallopeptidase [Nannocystaceae bacterium]